jgi:hypothetical protein
MNREGHCTHCHRGARLEVLTRLEVVAIREDEDRRSFLLCDRCLRPDSTWRLRFAELALNPNPKEKA